MILPIAFIIGALVGIYCVYAVVFVYKYKGTSRATTARVLGGSSVAIAGSLGLYFLKYVFWDGTELDFKVSIAFSLSIIVSMIVFFWINRKKIG